MIRLTESAIEGFAIKLFGRFGYNYIHALDIAPDGVNVVMQVLTPRLLGAA